MSELTVHVIDCVEPADCRLILETNSTEYHLFARNVSTVPIGDSMMGSVGGFEPIPLFHRLALSPFQIRELVRLCTEIRTGSRFTFPLRIREVN